MSRPHSLYSPVFRVVLLHTEPAVQDLRLDTVVRRSPRSGPCIIWDFLAGVFYYLV